VLRTTIRAPFSSLRLYPKINEERPGLIESTNFFISHLHTSTPCSLRLSHIVVTYWLSSERDRKGVPELHLLALFTLTQIPRSIRHPEGRTHQKMSWLLSPASLFSRTSSSASSSSVPTLFSSTSTPKRSVDKSKGDEDAPSTPFEQEYGVPDLPGGWPGCVSDLKVRDLTAKSFMGSANGVELDKVDEVDEQKRSSDPQRESLRDRDRDIRITRLVVHPIKVSHQQQSSFLTTPHIISVFFLLLRLIKRKNELI
jgi:hypothetical protein